MSTDNKRYKEIDILRGIGIVFVLLGHAIIVYPIDLHEIRWCSFLFDSVSAVHMPLLFAVSGYCFNYRGDYKQFIIKKAKRILVPYVFFGCVGILPGILFSSLVNKNQSVIESITKLFLNGGGYWFLYTLFIIFAIFPILLKLYEKSKLIFGGLILFLTVVSFTELIPDIFTLRSVCYYLFYFSAGYIVRQNTSLFDKINQQKILKTILLPISLIIWIACTYFEVLYVPYIEIIGAIAGIISLIYFALWIRRWKCYQLCEFSKYSLQLYLFNGYFLVIARTISVTILHVTNPVLIIVFNMIVTLYISWFIIKFICEKIKILKVLLGMM